MIAHRPKLLLLCRHVFERCLLRFLGKGHQQVFGNTVVFVKLSVDAWAVLNLSQILCLRVELPTCAICLVHIGITGRHGVEIDGTESQVVLVVEHVCVVVRADLLGLWVQSCCFFTTLCVQKVDYAELFTLVLRVAQRHIVEC